MWTETMTTRPKLSHDLQRQIGTILQRAHEGVLDEPLPARMRGLLERLDGRGEPDHLEARQGDEPARRH
ncbi:hypothetical protein OHA_1_03644 [Pleomorphomonas sp. SM30]|uniref:Anti-sigma factor NepR domain-containing protein n=2 Tax=Oharaeibacter diazotrophicus TaxID=1920512 RepID=A0A4V3CW54_9HYPH|nr:hypothetical protein EDD54_1893 [Oharaeibacter diazotrophicus]BBE74018.1 hypothetical protein OHA_1_03644 [Pleomorphomonas sp. SM30]GLS76294.1 hypothetical protein GCM10007904_16290 [Oharaeibacter diazotrophicus]